MLTAVLLLGGLVHAAITSPSGSSVLLSMQGPAGLRIEGTTHELTISERDGELVFEVPLSGVDTGIGLRNRHLRGYLDVAHFPTAALHVARKTVQLPAPGKWAEADAPGTLTIRGVSRPCTVHYRAEGGAGGDVRVRGTIGIDMRDFGVEVPSYLGVSVDPAVSIQVDFSLRDL
ncbi:MAG TPA: YceI family protein [Myxococcaceae bacterium]|nr:YceI family protein [Myxococcaceae bacterium]